MAKLEIGSGFLVSALGGFDLFNSIIANVILLTIAAVLISHGTYEIVKPRLLLKRTIEGWLVKRHWVLTTESSPSLHFGWHGRDPQHRNGPILISRSKNDDSMITFSAQIPLDKPMRQWFSSLNDQQRKLIEIELRYTLELQNVGFDTIRWPVDDVRIQTALAIDDGLSEHAIDLEGKRVLNTILASRAAVQRLLVQWGFG